MGSLKITSWNVEHLEKLLNPATNPNTERKNNARLANVVRQVQRMDSDILCLVEGPHPDRIDDFTDRLDGYTAIKAADGNYAIGAVGNSYQWIWFLVKDELAADASLLPVATYDQMAGGAKWDVHYWGNHKVVRHNHYRHPQVLVLEQHGQRFEFIGLHLKSKFVSRNQEKMWKDEATREKFIEGALKARIKLATEAVNVRRYIEAKFGQVENPALFVMGDLNDGVGKEYFERRYLFFDLLSGIQGDMFYARKFLYHALFDAPQHLRWSIHHDNFVEDIKNQELLLDHILFTQGLANGSLPWQVEANAGFVEHESYELTNAGQYKYARSSDHRPISVRVTTPD